MLWVFSKEIFTIFTSKRSIWVLFILNKKKENTKMMSLIKECFQLSKWKKGRKKLKKFRVSMNSLLRSIQEVCHILCRIMEILKNILILQSMAPINIRLIKKTWITDILKEKVNKKGWISKTTNLKQNKTISFFKIGKLLNNFQEPGSKI